MYEAGSPALSDERLRSLFEPALERPLVVVQAPAGYGKSAAVWRWLQASATPHAWLTLGPEHNDRSVLGAALAAALAPWSQVAVPGPDEWGQPRLTWIPELAQQLREAPPPHPLLVLDGYQVVDDEAANELVQALLDALPREVRVLITTRRKPALRLARRAASGTLATIEYHQLALQDAPPWTEGWPLAEALSGSGGDAAEVIAGPLADYVEQVVFADFSPEQRELLLALAPLRRFDPSLAEAVCGVKHTSRSLQTLAAHFAIVPVAESDSEGDGEWLSVHPPWRAAITALGRRRDPEAAAGVHDRASAAFEQAGMFAPALEESVAAGDVERTAGLLREHALRLVAERRHEPLREALALLADHAPEPPALTQALALILAAADGQEMRGLSRRARALAQALPDDASVQLLMGLLLAAPDAGAVSAAIKTAEQGRERSGPTGPLNGEFTRVLGIGLWLDGRFEDARKLLAPLLGRDTQVHQRSGAYTVLALVAAQDGDAQLAERYARTAVELSAYTRREVPADLAIVHAALAESLCLAGKLDEARAAADHALALVSAGSLRHGLILITHARVALAQRRREDARALSARAKGVLRKFGDVGRGTTARLDAIDAILAQRSDEAPEGSQPTPAEMRVLRALAASGSRAQIARELFLSETTVKSHLRRLYRRLGASNRDEALAAARDRGLLDVPQAPD